MTWQLLAGSYEEHLPILPADSFNMVMLDPPYFPSAAFDKKKRESIFDWTLLAKECNRTLAPSGAVILWGNQPRLMQHYQKYFSQYFQVHSETIWAKTAANLVISWRKPLPRHENAWILTRIGDRLQLSLQRTAKQRVLGASDWQAPPAVRNTGTYSSSHGKRGPATRGGPRQPLQGSYAKTLSKYASPRHAAHGTGYYLTSVITTKPIHGGHPEYLGHPTQKALDVMKPLISLTTKPGDVILDPFAGSGSTLLAAEMLGRNSVGIELNPKFVQLAWERLEAWNGHA